MLPTYLRIAARNLVRGGRRSALLGLAIAMVTMLFVWLIGLTTGLESSMIRSATTLMSGHVNVGGFYKMTRSRAAPVVTEASKVRALVEAQTPGLDYIIDRERGWARIVSETSSFQAGIVGIDPTEEQGLRDALEIVRSEGDRGLDALSMPGTALVFESQVERLGIDLGDVLTIAAPTFRGVNNTLDARVVAVARDVGFMSAWNVFVPKGTVQTLYQVKPDSTGAIMIYLRDPDEAGAVMRHLRLELEAAGYDLLEHRPVPFYAKFDTVAAQDWTGQRLDVTVWRDEVSFLLWILAGFATIRWILVIALTAIIVIGIMNTLWMAIRERTREIGTLRAIGMDRPGVVQMFVFEALILGAAATALGVALGVAVAAAVNAANLHIPVEAFRIALMSDRLYLEIRASDVAQVAAGITATTGLASLYPAWRAARMRPITAIHRVG